MHVILLERVEKLGRIGDVVKVKPGFARNFLLPQKKALRATEANKKVFEARRADIEADNASKRGDAEVTAKQLDGLSVVLIRQAGESGQLYGSVSPRDLAAAVSEKGVAIDKKQVRLDHVIKLVGLHQIKIALHPEVIVTITANVARSDDEAQTQLRTGRAVTVEEQRAAEEAALDAAVAEVEAAEAAEAAKAAEEAEASEETKDNETETKA